MSKVIALIAALALVIILISGCTQQTQNGQTACGNGECGAGETVDSCPADCEAPPMPAEQATGENEGPPSLPF